MRIPAMLALVPLFACAKDDATTPVAGGADAGVELSTDPFCRTRPRLDYCEDFDEGDIATRLEPSLEGDHAIVARVVDADAPSPPYVLDVAQTATSLDARLLFDGKTGVKYNLFFFVKIAPGHGRVDLAGLRDGDYELDLGVEEDDRWYVEERSPGAEPRHLTSDFKPKLADFWSVRFDVYADGNGRGHLRFRSGGDTVWLEEPLVFGGTKPTLTPRFYVGARTRSGAPAHLAFDNVAVGED